MTINTPSNKPSNKPGTTVSNTPVKAMSKMKHASFALMLSAVLALGFLVAMQLIETRTAAAADLYQDGPSPLCRFGVNFNTERQGETSDLNNYDIASLRAGWYIDYLAPVTPTRPGGINYAHMIRLVEKVDEDTGELIYNYYPRGEALANVIANNPGATWFIGNEPDRIEFQDGMPPALYAEAYHDIYHLLKDRDATAQVFAGSIVQPTEVRMEYLDLVVDAYEEAYDELLPVDGWSIHNFILNERSCDAYNDNVQICWGADIPPGVDATDGLIITTDELDRTMDLDLFIEQILRFRYWMGVRGYTGVPVYLSEYGVLLPNQYDSFDFSPAAINEYMNDTFDYVLNTTDPDLGDPTDGHRLIQRLSWYSVNDDFHYNGWLFDSETFERSEMGDNYAAYTGALSETVDLYPVTFNADPPYFSGMGDPISVTLEAHIANSGNTVAAQEATVRFYEGNPATDGIQIGEAVTVSLAGCGEDIWVETTWSNATPGVYDLYVEVEPGDGVSEVNAANNLASRLFFTSTGQVFIPQANKELTVQ